MPKSDPYKFLRQDIEVLLDEMAEKKAPVEDYIEALEDLRSHIDICIEAAQDDIKRRDAK